MPLFAKFETRDRGNNKIKAEAGYGKWLLPGQEVTLSFSLPKSKYDASLNCRLELLDSAGEEVLSRELTVATPVSSVRK